MNLTIILIILISILTIICISILFYLIKTKNNDSKIDLTSLNDKFETNKELITKEIEKDTEITKTNLINLKETVNKQKEDLTKSLDKLEENIKKFNEITNNINTIDKKVDTSVKNINELSLIFKNSKTRGNLGEFTLEWILTNVLGEKTDNGIWQTQYKYKNSNVIVDAIIKTQINDKKIAIDSKFPLTKANVLISENTDSYLYKQAEGEFKQTIKNMIKELNNKYISNSENVSSVIMFIPSEAIFELIWSKFTDIFSEAIKNKIWICSPTTLPAVLYSQQISIKEYKISKNINEIQKLIKTITDDVKRLLDRNEKMSKIYEKYKTETEEVFKEFQTSANKIDKNYSKLETINIDDNQE
ncbi:DNA recombination protein RmuC [Mycoplasma mycoides subsp. capri]|uniref:DNA recombination protein RmuC n=1 Tax=Mycoplasma mycoides TaxID=2102 RepID=UPI00223FE05A|nr:DNA recombination protein RmuC [Mycoplasma mycoides]UZK64005.1 DNA recombination protein RmuC [Mycoplasma mycoides subsp. capri]